MKHYFPILACAALALSMNTAHAQDDDKPADQAVEAKSERVVKQEAGQQVEETRIDGRLQSVRVKPPRGPAYFFDDRAGDGSLSSPQGGELDSQFNIRTWKLGEW